ncbi:MAG: hypothetical protein PUH30_00580 [Oscillospiraceae bacterium]|nr:hypothetical protein [Oscillospiraceae bacterium]
MPKFITDCWTQAADEWRITPRMFLRVMCSSSFFGLSDGSLNHT